MAQHLHKGGLGGLEAVVWACGMCDEVVCNGGGWWATGGLKGQIAAQLPPVMAWQVVMREGGCWRRYEGKALLFVLIDCKGGWWWTGDTAATATMKAAGAVGVVMRASRARWGCCWGLGVTGVAGWRC